MSMDAEQVETFSKDEIVWAKIRGYPWWPGIIAEVIKDKQSSEPQKYLVNFIGDNSQSSTVPLSNLLKYAEKYDEIVPKIKTKQHKDSVAIADLIRKGETTYEAESKKLAKKKPPLTKQPNQRSSNKKKTRSSFSSSDEGPYSRIKLDSDDMTKSNNIHYEIQELLKLVNDPKPNPNQIESKVYNLIQLIDTDRPDLLEILQSPSGKQLLQISTKLSDNKKLAQANLDYSSLIDKLKSSVLKIFFNPTEIIQQLHHVSGYKKITSKLLEKLQTDQHCNLKSDDDSSAELEDQSDSEDASSEEEEDEESSELSIKKPRGPKPGQLKKQIVKKKQQIVQSPRKPKRVINEIANPLLRNKVCQKIGEAIQDITDIAIPKKYLEELENKIRDQDPNMGIKYKRLYRKILDSVKKISKSDLQNQVSGTINVDQLWSLLNTLGQSLQDQ